MVVRRRLLIRNSLILVLSLFAVYEVYNFVGLRTRVVVVEVHQSQQQFSDKLSYTRDLLHETSALNHTPISNISVRRTPKLTQDYVIPEIERSRPSNDSKSFIKQRKLLDDSTKHYKIFVGILSAKRDPPTVARMAKELVRHVTEGDYKFATWISHSAAGEENVISQLKEVGFEVYISNNPYRELEPDRVHITFGDSLERMKWRTTHVLDYANLLERSLKYDTDFVLVLEDDLKPAKHALDKTYYAASEQLRNHEDWAILTLFGKKYRRPSLAVVTSLSSFGGCTMLFKRTIVPGMIEYLRHDPYEAPVDLLIPRYIESLSYVQIYERTPNLFQHISQHSSYQRQDKEKRKTERGRSITFLYDEDNKTLASLPAKRDGYIGCFIDQGGPERRDLSGLYAYATDGVKYRKPSPTLCKKFCKGYFYYGLQNGGDCHCGNEFGRYGWAAENECNKPCILQESKMCGGNYRNSVYRV